MFKIYYKYIKGLPKLAWLVEINRIDKIVSVFHGENVECQKDFVVAGVWDGEFAKANFDISSVFWGTGVKFSSDQIKFVTPSHALERLVLCEDEEGIVVSNSFPFIMAYKNYCLEDKENQYESIMCSMIHGFTKMQECIPMKARNEIKQYIASVLIIDKDLKITKTKRPVINDFQSFDDYYSRIIVALNRIKNNSCSKARKTIQYGLTTTISSGYDSSTCAALAKKIGCNTAMTLMSGRYDKDSGEEIAKYLGYTRIIKRDCESYKEKKGCIDAEYVSSGEAGTQLQFSVFEDVMANTITFFGVRGCYWDKDSKTTDDFEMDDHYFCEADVSWTENALKNSYIVAPLPTYGSSTCSSIRKVTNLEEMKFWTLGTKYDKPIPRRILEESGVPRDAFGMKKFGGGFTFSYETKRSLKRKMTKEGYKDFIKYEKETGYQRRCFSRVINRMKYFMQMLPIYFNVINSRLGTNLKVKSKPGKFSNPGATVDLFFWSVEIMKNKYMDALNSGGIVEKMNY